MGSGGVHKSLGRYVDVEARAGAYGTPDYVSRRMRATVTNATQ